MSHHPACGLARCARRLSPFLACWLFASIAFSAEPRKHFDLPAGAAEMSLKKFSEQSGAEVLFATRQIGRASCRERV